MKILAASVLTALCVLFAGFVWGVPESVHNHFTKPTGYMLAANSTLIEYVDVTALVVTYEYIYRSHVDSLKPNSNAIQLEIWKAEKERIVNTLKHYRNKSERLKKSGKMIAAGKMPS